MSIYEIVESMPDKKDKKTSDLFNFIGDIKRSGYLKRKRLLKF